MHIRNGLHNLDICKERSSRSLVVVVVVVGCGMWNVECGMNAMASSWVPLNSADRGANSFSKRMVPLSSLIHLWILPQTRSRIHFATRSRPQPSPSIMRHGNTSAQRHANSVAQRNDGGWARELRGQRPSIMRPTQPSPPFPLRCCVLNIDVGRSIIARHAKSVLGNTQYTGVFQV